MANPGVKIDPEQKRSTQSRAIVRRLILRLHFIFSVAMWEAYTRVYIFPVKKKKKKTMEIAILEFLPGKAQPLVRKLDSLLAAVEFPGNV